MPFLSDRYERVGPVPVGMGPARFMDRAEFVASSFPQPACERQGSHGTPCRQRAVCDSLLAQVVPGEVWVVRDRMADGRWRCGRPVTGVWVAVDVIQLRRAAERVVGELTHG